ncbi:MAG: peptide chain release factor-like protein [Desulfobacter sp.]|nr:MAG: peptide chain release factor-like protein [Desulfobacter sp.]
MISRTGYLPIRRKVLGLGPGQQKIDALEKKMAALGIRKQDIREKFIKASGRGGQKLNKSSSAVFLVHTPTGISVKVGKTRSQHLNRFLALRGLVEKIEAQKSGGMSPEDRKIAKLKKQKQRRKRKSLKKKRAADEIRVTVNGG